MAKKTNKTDHVLNLLAGVKAPEQEEEKETAQEQPQKLPAAPLQEQPARMAASETGQPVQKISVIHTSSSEKDPVAEVIKGALEEQADAMEKGMDLTEEPLEEDKLPDEIPPLEPSPEETAERAAGQPQAAAEQSGKSRPPTEAEAPRESRPPRMEIPAKVQPEEHKYVFYNVMETLIRDKVLDYMKKFGICTCDRCITDTTALALNHVPPKYVVVDKEAVSPLKNYYERAYVGEITVALSRACIVVGGNPYHDR